MSLQAFIACLCKFRLSLGWFTPWLHQGCQLWYIWPPAAVKSLQSCPTLCDPIDGSPPGSPVSGILQAGTLEWVAISFSNAWKWKVKGKSLSRVRLFAIPWTAAYQAPLSMGFSRQEYWSGVPLPSPMVEWTRSKCGAVTKPTEGVGAGVSFPWDPLGTPSAQARGVSGALHLLREGSKGRRRSSAALPPSSSPDARLLGGNEHAASTPPLRLSEARNRSRCPAKGEWLLLEWKDQLL